MPELKLQEVTINLERTKAGYLSAFVNKHNNPVNILNGEIFTREEAAVKFICNQFKNKVNILRIKLPPEELIFPLNP